MADVGSQRPAQRSGAVELDVPAPPGDANSIALALRTHTRTPTGITTCTTTIRPNTGAYCHSSAAASADRILDEQAKARDNVTGQPAGGRVALVRLLGPVAVVGDEGSERHPGSPLRRAILALLGL